MPSYKQIWRYLLIGIISSCVCCLAVTLLELFLSLFSSSSSISSFTRFLALFARFPCNLQRNTVIICTKSSTSSCCCDFSVLSIISISQLYKLVHRFLIPHIPSIRYLCHCRVAVSQQCHRIASFLRLVLIQIPSTLYTRIKKTVY